MRYQMREMRVRRDECRDCSPIKKDGQIARPRRGQRPGSALVQAVPVLGGRGCEVILLKVCFRATYASALAPMRSMSGIEGSGIVPDIWSIWGLTIWSIWELTIGDSPCDEVVTPFDHCGMESGGLKLSFIAKVPR